jgi:lactoylglutathione lyase
MHCKMTHQMIRVYDLDRSIQFYKDALGMHETRRKDVPKGKFTLVYLGDGESDFELELTYNYNPASPYTLGNGYGHLAVYVDDLEKVYEEHQAKGYCVGPLKGLSDDGKKNYYFLTDPDGYQIEVMRRPQ